MKDNVRFLTLTTLISKNKSRVFLVFHQIL